VQTVHTIDHRLTFKYR